MTAITRFRTSLDRLMAHADRDVRLQAARCVGRLPGPVVIARLRALAEDPDVHVRREALRSLADRAPSAGRATLRRAFNDEPDLECRRAALNGLVTLGDNAVLPAIRRLLRNPDAYIYEQSPATQANRQALCCEAVAALAVIGDPSTVPDLVALLEHHVSPTLDDAVIRTLAHLGETGRAAIAQIVREAPPHRARSAVEALAAQVDAGETDALAMFMGHTDAGVRRAAAAAVARHVPSHSALLRRAGDADPRIRALVAAHAGPTMPTVLELLLDDPAPTVVRAALAALPAVPRSQRSPDLAWRVRRKARVADPETACRALETLVELAPEAATIDLLDRLGDATAPASVRVAAARLLCELGAPDLAPRLLAAVFENDAALRQGMLDGLLTLARRPDGAAVLDAILGVARHDPPAPPRRGRTAGRRSNTAMGLAERAAPAWRPEVQAIPDGVTAPTLRLVRIAVVERLAEIPTREVTAALADIVAHTTDRPLRAAAATALARAVEDSGDRRHALDRVATTLLHDLEPELRLAGLRVLAAGDGPAHLERIVDALDDPDAALRARAARWIGDVATPLDVAVVARLEARLNDRNTSVRLAAMTALARRRGNQAAALLIEAAITAGDEVMPAVAHVLDLLEPEVVHRELARQLARASSRDRQLALLRLSDAILARSLPQACAA